MNRFSRRFFCAMIFMSLLLCSLLPLQGTAAEAADLSASTKFSGSAYSDYAYYPTCRETHLATLRCA